MQWCSARKENTLRRTVYNQYIWAAGALGVGSKWKATVSPMELTYLPHGAKDHVFRPGRSGQSEIH